MSNSLVAIEKKDRFNGEAAVPQEGHCPDKSIEEGPNGDSASPLEDRKRCYQLNWCSCAMGQPFSKIQ